MAELVLCEQRDQIATLRLNRPEKHNAMSPDMLTACCEHVERLQEARATRVLIVRGQGTAAFTAGYDISRLPERQDSARPTPNDGQALFARFIEHIRTFPAPTIAMIYGYCMGGGLELAATCDIRIAADSGRFRMPPARLGVLYSGEGLLRFMHLIGPAHTAEIFFTACTFDAPRAQAMGLLNHVLPADELESYTYAMAEQIAQNAPLSVQHTKRLLGLIQSRHDVVLHAEIINNLRDACMQSDDFQEGRRAFLEKRPPVFHGR